MTFFRFVPPPLSPEPVLFRVHSLSLDDEADRVRVALRGVGDLAREEEKLKKSIEMHPDKLYSVTVLVMVDDFRFQCCNE
jgi:hypothetical protein